MTDYAKQWEALLSATQEPEEEPTAEIELLGFKFVGRRIPLQLWVRSGRLPQALLKQMLEARNGEDSSVNADRMTPQEIVASINFQRDAVCGSLVEPRIVDHGEELKEGELRYSYICEGRPDLVDAIVQWVLAGSPGVPLRVKEGEMSVNALSTFPDKRPARKRPSSRNGVQTLRKTA